jgi:hypothetical protein
MVQLVVKGELEQGGLIVADGAAKPGAPGCNSWATRNGVNRRDGAFRPD